MKYSNENRYTWFSTLLIRRENGNFMVSLVFLLKRTCKKETVRHQGGALGSSSTHIQETVVVWARKGSWRFLNALWHQSFLQKWGFSAFPDSLTTAVNGQKTHVLPFFTFSSRIMADTAWSFRGPRGKWDSEPLSLPPREQDPLRINSTHPFTWRVSLTVARPKTMLLLFIKGIVLE